MSVPAELCYTAEHEWVKLDGSAATVGITDFAAKALGDVVYVSLPAEGAAVTAEEPCGEVESTKSVSDLYAPVDGQVTQGPGPGRGRRGWGGGARHQSQPSVETGTVLARPAWASAATSAAVSTKPVFGTPTAAANTTPYTLPLGAISGPPELPGSTLALIS